jgi:hypothetical protein
LYCRWARLKANKVLRSQPSETAHQVRKYVGIGRSEDRAGSGRLDVDNS